MGRICLCRVVLSVAAVVCGLCLRPGGANAQQEPAEPIQFAHPSKDQLSLNDDAVRAIIKGDYATAVAMLEEANGLGELDVTYLNLGRAYQKLGQCAKAREALSRALAAPKVRKPSPTYVTKKVAQYRDELDASCEEKKKPKTAATTPGRSSTKPPAARPVAKPARSMAARDAGSSVAGWATTAVGVAAMAGGGALFLVANSERDKVRSQPTDQVVTARSQRDAKAIEDRANTYDTIGVATLSTGAVVTGVGLYLLLADRVEPSQSTVAVGLQPHGASVLWRMQF